MASFTTLSGIASSTVCLGRPPGLGRLEAAEAPEEVEVLGVVEVDFVGPALLGPVHVDVGVGEDLVEPGLEVRALLEPAEAAVRAQVGLLHEIFGVGRVAGHAQRARVERIHERHRVLGEIRLIGHTRRVPGVRPGGALDHRAAEEVGVGPGPEPDRVRRT